MDSGHLYVRHNVKMLSTISIPEGLIIDVITYNSKPNFEPDDIFLMCITYYAERLTCSIRLNIDQFFNGFKTLWSKPLNRLIMPKMPPYFDGTAAINCHQMESLYLERRIYRDSFERLTSLKRLHFSINLGITYDVRLPPNLEYLTVHSSIEETSTPSKKLALTIRADACTKLRHT